MNPLGTRVVDILQRPVAVYVEEGEPTRHATWLELFFDLVFIVAVAQLGDSLREELTMVGILEYASLFVLVWWTWVGFSYYADVFDTDDLFSALALILVMFGVLALSQTIHDALHGGSFAFTAAFLLLRLLYIGLTLRGWYVVTGNDKFFSYWVTFSTLSTVVWALSLAYPDPGRYGLWISAFLLEVAGIGIVYLVFDDIPVQVSHFPERLGLFTILVLGETIIAVSVATSGIDWGLRTAATALGGFAIAVAIWWLYFNNFDERTINRALQSGERHWLHMRERMLVFVFGHYFVFAGVAATGVGLHAAIDATIQSHTIDPAARVALAGGIAAFLVGSAVCHRSLPTPLHDHLFAGRLLTAGLVIVGAVVGATTAPFIAIWSIAVILVALVALEGVHRLSRGNPEEATDA